MFNIKKVLTIIFILTSLSLFGREVPLLSGPVVDEIGILSLKSKEAIATGIYNLNLKNHVQFQVLIIDTLKDETIESYSIKVVDQWKLGKKGDDKGALFLIALNDHKMRIEVGQGLEGDLTDLKTKRILKEVSPLFKKNDFDNGVALGLALMARSLNLEISFDKNIIRPRHERKIGGSTILFILLIFIFVLEVIASRFRGRGPRGPGGFSGGAGSDWYGGGGGFSSGSSGGDWSGGGGGFSGGGASGDW